MSDARIAELEGRLISVIGKCNAAEIYFGTYFDTTKRFRAIRRVAEGDDDFVGRIVENDKRIAELIAEKNECLDRAIEAENAVEVRDRLFVALERAVDKAVSEIQDANDGISPEYDTIIDILKSNDLMD